MKKRLCFLVFILVHPFFAMADLNTDFLASVILISYISNSDRSHLNITRLQDFSLSDWSEPDESGAKLFEKCDIIGEARLIGTLRSNFLSVVLRNKSKKALNFNPIAVEYIFDNGLKRKPDIPNYEIARIDVDQYYQILLPFSEKENFKGQKSLNVIIPFENAEKNCAVDIQFIRNTLVPDSSNNWLTKNTFEFSLHAGGNSYSGSLANLARWSDLSGGFQMSFWGDKDLSFMLGYSVTSGSRANADFLNELSAPTNSDLKMSRFAFGIEKRFVENKFESFKFGFDATSYYLEVESSSTSFKKYLNGLGIGVNTSYQKQFSTLLKDTIFNNLYWGVQGSAHYCPQLWYSESEQSKTMRNSRGGIYYLGLYIGTGI